MDFHGTSIRINLELILIRKIESNDNIYLMIIIRINYLSCASGHDLPFGDGHGTFLD